VSDLPAVVLGGLWTLIDALGFAPQVESCVRCGRTLGADEVGRFDVVSGGVRCQACADGVNGPRMGPIARAQLVSMLAGEPPAALTHARQHFSLVADFVSHHVVAKPLKSIPFLTGLLPAEQPAPP
jgi:recombinational DNA repair protein (RecF pathway)